MQTLRYGIALGFDNAKSSWQGSGLTSVFDLSGINVAAAGTLAYTLLYMPLVNQQAARLKNSDQLPNLEPIGGVLAAAVGNRVVGSAAKPLGTLQQAFFVHLTAAGGVYNPAATVTATLAVRSVVGGVVGAESLISAPLNLTTAPNGVDAFTLVATDGRGVSLDGAAVPTNPPIHLYGGDVLYVKVNNAQAGAFTVPTGNNFGLVLDWA